jgi:hypothetical protein
MNDAKLDYVSYNRRDIEKRFFDEMVGEADDNISDLLENVFKE